MKSYKTIKERKRGVNYFSLFTLFLTLLFASCLKEMDNGGNQIRFDVSIAPHSRVATDANFKTTWEDGDKIGLFAVRHAPDVEGKLATWDNYIDNMVLTYNKQSNTWTSHSTIYFPRGGDQLDFYAYYPYDETLTDPANIKFNISADQNAITNGQSNYNRSDAMFSNGTKNVDVKTPSVSLVFSHVLAMVQLRVHDSYGSLGEMTATLHGCTTGASGDLSSGTVTASGEAQSVKMFRLEHSGDKTSYTYRAVVPAQSIVNGIKLFHIQAGSSSYHSPALSEAVALTAGKVVSYTMNQRFYKIGDYYPNDKDPIGVVFWLDNPVDSGSGNIKHSEHGKIVSLDEPPVTWNGNNNLEGKLTWGTEANTKANSTDDGRFNEAKVKLSDSSLNSYPAFKWCHNKPEGGKKWYLPATGELETIFNVKQTIKPKLATAGKELSNDWYWSSTEGNVSNANQVYLGLTVKSQEVGKSGSYHVRAVAAF